MELSPKLEEIKMKVNINEIENRKTIERNSQSGSWFFEKINKPLGKPSCTLTKKRQRTQINKIINVKKHITSDTTEIQRS